MRCWQMDFKDVTSVPPDPEGKQRHVVEIFNVVDVGTSIILDCLPREDYNMETAIVAITNTLLVHGIPQTITFDRDPRFIGSWSAGEFPSAFMRFLLCVGVQIDPCPPRRPDKNAFVERLQRTQQEECLQVHHPVNLEQTQEWWTPSVGITIMNAPTRLAPVATVPLTRRSPVYLACLLCPIPSTRIGGWAGWTGPSFDAA
jgi:hypothetical protein